jgi:HEAT repeat protein
MARTIMCATRLGSLFLAGATTVLGQDASAPQKGQEAKLIAVLKSSSASQKEKADVCRELARIGTKDAVAPLAALLGDEKLGHMARYGLEPIPDPAVDNALREALGRLSGRPLVGAIGSIGVRRDAKAVEPLTRLLRNTDSDVVKAAARALGMIGTSAAAKALEETLASTPAANRPAIYEGLFRSAEALTARGQHGEPIAIYQAAEIYDRLMRSDVPPQVREGASRKARLLRQEQGPRL